MTFSFVVTNKGNPRQKYFNVEKGDQEQFQIDFRPWQDDNDTITSVTWKVESGMAGLGTQTFNGGIASAILAFPQAGRSIVSALAQTATRSKKMYLNIDAHDETLSIYMDGYYTLGYGI